MEITVIIQRERLKKPHYVLTSKAVGIEAFKKRYEILQYFDETFSLRPSIKAKKKLFISIHRPHHF